METPRKEIADLCRQFGKVLKVPAGIDGVRVMWALAGNEGRFGDWYPPRHEPGYCHGGRYFDPKLTHAWGCWAHCSYGPLQIMYPNATGWTPKELVNPYDNFEAAIAFINREIFDKQHAPTLEAIADAYNSGNWKDNNVPKQYIADFLKHYALELPL